MGFKLGKKPEDLFNKIKSESNKEVSVNHPVIRKKLEPGVQAEANKEGTTFVDPSVDLNSEEGRNILAHEEAHHQQFGENWDTKLNKVVEEKNENTVPRFDYNNKFVFWEGKKTPRANMNEGSHQLEWEADAEARVNKLKTKNKIKRNYYG